MRPAAKMTKCEDSIEIPDISGSRHPQPQRWLADVRPGTADDGGAVHEFFGAVFAIPRGKAFGLLGIAFKMQPAHRLNHVFGGNYFRDAENHVAIAAALAEPEPCPLLVGCIAAVAPERDHDPGTADAQMVGHSGK